MTKLDENAPEVSAVLSDPTLTTYERYKALEELREQKRYAEDDGVINAAQQVYIDNMILYGNSAQAYRIAYPNCSESSLYSSASRLRERPSIQKRIEEGRLKRDLENTHAAAKDLLKKNKPHQRPSR